MAIQVNGTDVISNERALKNIASLDATTSATLASALGGGVTVSVNAPSSPSEGDLWYGSGSLDGYLRIYTEGSWSIVAWVGDGTEQNSGHLFVGSTTADKTYSWTVPNGVYQFSAVVISASASGYNTEGWGYGGGGLAYKNNVSCSPGDVFTVTIAPRGAGNRSSGETGTRLFKSGVIDLHARAGYEGSGGASTPGSRTVSGSDGGGNGGAGGTMSFEMGEPYPSGNYGGAGSGGAAGYSGNGGQGAVLTSVASFDGSDAPTGGGGGGGGGTYNTEYQNGYYSIPAGGGVSPYGAGSSGVGGSGDTDANAEVAGVNTEGVSMNGSMTNVPPSSAIDVVAFGAGRPSGNVQPWNTDPIPRSTSAGACRIVWGQSNNASFPSTNVGYRDGFGIGEAAEAYSS